MIDLITLYLGLLYDEIIKDPMNRPHHGRYEPNFYTYVLYQFTMIKQFLCMEPSLVWNDISALVT